MDTTSPMHPPDPKPFLAAVYDYYRELLRYHRESADIAARIVNSLDTASVYKDGRRALDTPQEGAGGAVENGSSSNGTDVPPVPDKVQHPAAPHEKKKGRGASRAKAEGEKPPSDRSRAPSTERLPAPSLGESILQLMRQNPSKEYSSSDILREFNESIPPKGAARTRTMRRYSDRLGKLVSEELLERVEEGRYRLKEAPKEVAGE